MASSSSSSSSHDHQIKHDVFISFRGWDTRRGFLSHVEKELRREQINPYVDEKLNRGDEIASSLLKAIEESQISLIIFSKNYASSRWCLDELAKIIECMEENKQIVLPVFYNIDPSVVRHQKGPYEDAFAEHGVKFQENMGKVQNWRSALKKAADLSGYDSSNYKNDAELIEDIVKDILEKLDCMNPSESKGLVGIDRHLARIESLLETEARGVKFLGIWGMAGIGKTTIAHAVFDKFSSRFEGCCFLENIREKSNENKLRYLRDELLSKLLEGKSDHLKTMLSRKKVFVVLDDVSTRDQLNYLVREQICLGRGSTVIVTSKDKHVLTSGGVCAIHEVKKLNFKESLKLFSLNAFGNSHPEKGYEELSKKAVAYAKGVPLALKVLGSLLHSKSIKIWESELRKLKEYPNGKIQNVLEVSYGGLDDVEKDIFLDIAFFYKGEYTDHVMRLLDANNLYADSGIDSLVKKALITITNDNTIQMHDLIQEMGWEIVRQECREDPGRRSRLRDVEEVYDVLKNSKGTDVVKGIVLYASHFEDLQFSVDTLKRMTNLRILKFYSPCHVGTCNVHPPTFFESFYNELRFLEWDGYPLTSMLSSFHPEKLVEFSMPNNHVMKQCEEVQDFVISKRINHCRSMQLLDFSKAQKHERVDLCSSEGFCNADQHILSLSMIVALNQAHFKDFKTLDMESNFRSLRNFDVSFCFSVKEFLLSSKEITDLDFATSKFKIWYSSIGSLNQLERVIQGSSRLEILPINELYCLRSFEGLNLSDCRQMNQRPKLPILFDALLSLRELFLVGCSGFFKVPFLHSCIVTYLFIKVPATNHTFSLLRCLSIAECSIGNLSASMEGLPMLDRISWTNCWNLEPIHELPQWICLYIHGSLPLDIVFHSIIYACGQKDIFRYFLEAVTNNFTEFYSLVYLGSRVPKWFRWKQAMEASITMQLPVAAVDRLLGFVFCSVLHPSTSNGMWLLKFSCCFEDGEKLGGWVMPIRKLYSNSVLLWYSSFCYKRILNGVKRRGKGEDSTYFPKVTFEFCVVTYDDDNGERARRECLIQECGVHPIYASKQQMELALELKMKSYVSKSRSQIEKGRGTEILMLTKDSLRPRNLLIMMT